jgi:hypothetical protein
LVDASVTTSRHEPIHEDPSDPEPLSGHALLMKELGAEIISEDAGQ